MNRSTAMKKLVEYNNSSSDARAIITLLMTIESELPSINRNSRKISMGVTNKDIRLQFKSSSQHSRNILLYLQAMLMGKATVSRMDSFDQNMKCTITTILIRSINPHVHNMVVAYYKTKWGHYSYDST